MSASPSPQARRAAEAVHFTFDHSLYNPPSIEHVAAIIERETGCSESQVMIETADQIIRRLLQNPHDPSAQSAAGRWRIAYLAKHQSPND